MPKTVNDTQPRVQLRLPKPLCDEIDRIIQKYPFYGNRQVFIENAVREKLERVWQEKGDSPSVSE